MAYVLNNPENNELFKALTNSSSASRTAMYYGVAEVLVTEAIKRYLEVKDGIVSNKSTMMLVLRELACAINEDAILDLDTFNKIVSNVYKFKISNVLKEDIMVSPLSASCYLEVLGVPVYFSKADLDAINENFVDFKTAAVRATNAVDYLFKTVSRKNPTLKEVVVEAEDNVEL